MTPARVAFWLFIVAFAAAVVWPGVTYANRVEPYILGLPFNLAWIAGWVAAGGVALFLLDHSERRSRPGDEEG